MKVLSRLCITKKNFVENFFTNALKVTTKKNENVLTNEIKQVAKLATYMYIYICNLHQVGMARMLHIRNTLQKRKYLKNGAVSELLTLTIVFYKLFYTLKVY